MELHQFFRVGRLIPEAQDLNGVELGATVGDAFKLMREHDYDQLPVMGDGLVLGVFSYRSFAKNLHLFQSGKDPLKAKVDDFLDEPDFVTSRSEISTVLEAVARQGAVLVGSEDNLLAIATASDVGDFLWQASRPYLLLQDIELATRALMTKAFREEGDLTRCLTAANIPEAKKALDQLTFGDLMSVLSNAENYGRTFSSVFGGLRSMTQATLDPVREIRNKVLHFRDEPTLEDLETLVGARAWLTRKVRIAR